MWPSDEAAAQRPQDGVLPWFSKTSKPFSVLGSLSVCMRVHVGTFRSRVHSAIFSFVA